MITNEQKITWNLGRGPCPPTALNLIRSEVCMSHPLEKSVLSYWWWVLCDFLYE
jgi:hypothetical protein